MRMNNKTVLPLVTMLLVSTGAFAQFKEDVTIISDSTQTVVLTLEDALKIALSENIAVKVADQEIIRTEYALKGSYASLFPQIDASGAFQRTIKKQVMYMDFDMSAFGGAAGGPGGTPGEEGTPGEGDAPGESGIQLPEGDAGKSNGGGIEVGRWNTFNGGISASMPLINAQLWKSISISGDAVELAVEQARSSRLDMVTQVKQAFYAVLLAKEAFNVYKSVYDNAVDNFGQTEKRYKVAKASELEYTRAKANVASAIPNVFNSESQVVLALWQLKAVMGVELDRDIDVAGSLSDFTDSMLYEINEGANADLSGNTSIRQLAIQAEQLAKTVQLQKYATLPSLAVAFSYSMNAMTNDFNFSEYRWTPHSYVGLSLNIPIFAGGKRYNAIRQAKVQQVELDLQRVNTERQLQIAIRQYITTMETNMKSYYSSLETVELAQKAYDISEKSYNVGKSTITELNDARLTLTQAELAASQAVYSYLVAKSNLEKTIGHDFLDEEGNVALN